jgi:hypothetical protein
MYRWAWSISFLFIRVARVLGIHHHARLSLVEIRSHRFFAWAAFEQISAFGIAKFIDMSQCARSWLFNHFLFISVNYLCKGVLLLHFHTLNCVTGLILSILCHKYWFLMIFVLDKIVKSSITNIEREITDMKLYIFLGLQ